MDGLRGFQSIIGVAHGPGAVGIGSAKGFGHESFQEMARDRMRRVEVRQQTGCDREQARRDGIAETRILS